MTEQGRNRLVGAVILLSLAVILLPALFDGAGIEQRTVPPVPEPVATEGREIDDASDWAFLEAVGERRAAAPVTALPEHVREPEPAPELEREPEAEPAPAAEAVPEQPSSPGLDESGLPRAWSVQLASFRDGDNARSLRQRLLEDGFDAYLVEESENARPLYRVAVGPRIDRNAAVRLRDDLAGRYGLEGLVVRFALASGMEQGLQDGG